MKRNKSNNRKEETPTRCALFDSNMQTKPHPIVVESINSPRFVCCRRTLYGITPKWVCEKYVYIRLCVLFVCVFIYACEITLKCVCVQCGLLLFDSFNKIWTDKKNLEMHKMQVCNNLDLAMYHMCLVQHHSCANLINAFADQT